MDRTFCVYPCYQPSEGRILIHMVNSDYDAEANRMRPKEGITIRLRRPEFYKEVREARIYSPDFPDEGEGRGLAVTPTLEGDFIELTVPRLDVYNVIVI